MTDTRRRRILVVDDERAYLDACREGLGRICEVDTAISGDEGLVALDNADVPYDLVIADMVMPGMNGLDLLGEIHRRHPGLPVIVMTGFPVDNQLIVALQRGAWDFLRKPFRLEHLQVTVRSCLQRAESAGLPAPEARMDDRGWLELTGGSDFEYVERFKALAGLLFETYLDEEVAEDLRIAIDELGRNAVEWGNRFGPDKRIRLACRVFPEKVMLRIEDEGSGFDPNGIPDPEKDPVRMVLDRTGEGKRLGGYGIHLVRNLMDEVIYNEAGNAVVMARYIRPATAEPFRVEGGVLTVGVDLSGTTAERMTSACERLLEEPTDAPAIDLTGLKYVSSSGWRRLLKLHFEAEKRGKSLVVRIPPALEGIFTMAGLDRVLRLETVSGK